MDLLPEQTPGDTVVSVRDGVRGDRYAYMVPVASAMMVRIALLRVGGHLVAITLDVADGSGTGLDTGYRLRRMHD